MLENKTVWLINQYASTLDKGIGGRCYYFAKCLAKQGYNVFLFSASYHHLLKEEISVVDDFLSEKIDGFTYVWIKVPYYNNAHSKMRIINEFIFSHKLKKLNKFGFDSPNVIFYSSPALIPYLGAYKLAKKTNVKLVFDVRDLWPLTLIEMGGYSVKHPLIWYMHKIEKKAYVNSYRITSNWPYAIKYMSEHGARPEVFSWIPNGYSRDEFADPEKLDKSFIDRFPKNKFVVGYTGTLGTANALDALLNSAEILKPYSQIAIVVIGDGRDKDRFVAELSRRNLTNVFYLGSVRKRQIPSVLDLFDICYVGFLDIPLYRLGSSLTKLPEYLASGKPIVYASNSPFQPILDANAGITVQAENPQDIASAIQQLYEMSIQKRKELGDNGRKAATEHYEYSMIATKLAKVLFDE